MFDRARTYLRRLLRRDTFERDVADEFRFHIEARIDDLMARGLDADDARRRAHLEFGGVEQQVTRLREARPGAWLESVGQDVRLSMRRLRREPTFAVSVAVTLALGIGASTAVFGIASTTLLGRIPYNGADSLVVGGSTWKGDLELGSVSGLDYLDYRDSSRSFEHLAAFNPFSGSTTVTGDGEPWEVQAATVSWNLLATMRVVPALGRSFLPEEEAQADARVAIVSHGVWQRLGGTSDVVGRTIVLDGEPHTIVGVLPRGFQFVGGGRLNGSPRRWAEVWRVMPRPGEARHRHNYYLVGRLATGVPIERAQREVDGVSRALERAYPESNTGKGLRLVTLQEYLGGDVRTGLVLPAAATACLLLIACANVAGLLLARGQRRVAEVAMRSALGASRGRLIRQQLTEAVVLTLPSGVLGIGVAYVFQGLLLLLLPVDALNVTRPVIDGLVLLFAVASSIVTGLLVGVVPAIRGARTSPLPHLGTGRQGGERIPSGRLRGALVAAQIGVSVVLLVGAGLVARSLVRLSAVELGYSADRLLTARVEIQAPGYPERGQRHAFFASVVSEVAALPGVRAVSATSNLPILDPGNTWRSWSPDHRPSSDEEMQRTHLRRVLPGYFATMEMPLSRGRDVAATDRDGAPAVGVLSEALARRLYPGSDPVGRTILLHDNLSQPARDIPYVVVGVVRDARLAHPRQQPEPALYVSALQAAPTRLRLVVRVDGDPSTVVAPLRRIAGRLDRNALVTDVRAMDAVVDGAFADFRRVAGYLTLFAVVALLLAAVGLYGALAFHVTRQEHEIGVRLAMGATRAGILGLVMRRGGVVSATGLLAGLCAAHPATRVVRSLLFETTPLDGATYAGAALLLALTAATACLLPALRATRVDPAVVLKSE